jgi:phenylacetate-CoA ligase
VLERSRFLPEKLADFRSADAAGGLADRASAVGLRSERAAGLVHARQPDRRALCAAERSEIVRIYSTSGTTGAPSYIPLTSGDLDNWVTGSARATARPGSRPGSGRDTALQRRPVRCWGSTRRARPLRAVVSHPVGTGNSDRLLLAIERLEPEAVVVTPSYAAYLIELASERGVDLAASTVARVLVAGEPGGGEPAFRAKLEEGWGATVTEAMGIGDIGPSLWGECEEQDGMHLGARGFVHAELIDPETGVAVEPADGVEGELVLTHLRHRAAPLLRFRTRDHVQSGSSRCAAACPACASGASGALGHVLTSEASTSFASALREFVSAFAPDASAASSSAADARRRRTAASRAGRVGEEGERRRRARRSDP